MPRPARLPPARRDPRKAPHSHRTRTAAPVPGKGHRSGHRGQGQAWSLQRRPRVGRLLQCARRRCPRVGLGTGRESPFMLCKAHVQEPAPAAYVGEMKNAAQFWCDRVIKQYKETSVDCNVDGYSALTRVAGMQPQSPGPNPSLPWLPRSNPMSSNGTLPASYGTPRYDLLSLRVANPHRAPQPPHLCPRHHHLHLLLLHPHLLLPQHRLLLSRPLLELPLFWPI